MDHVTNRPHAPRPNPPQASRETGREPRSTSSSSLPRSSNRPATLKTPSNRRTQNQKPRTSQPTSSQAARRQQSDTAAPRIIDAPEYPIRRTPTWLTGAIAAFQGAIWSWVLLVVPAVSAFVAAAAQVTTDDSWRSAVAVASRIWLIAHGGTTQVADVTISLIPLGFTAIAGLSCYISARRTPQRSVATYIGFVGGYLVIVAVMALAFQTLTLRLVPVTLIVAGLAGYLGLRTGDLGDEFRARIEVAAHRLPTWLTPNEPIRAGIRGAIATWAVMVGCSALLVIVWAVAGRAASGDIIESLDPDPIGGIVLGLAQLGYVPTLVIWAVSWLSGTGFQVGAGSNFAPGTASLDPMPAVPLVSALPTGDMAGSWTQWLPVLVVGAGLLGAIVQWRKLRTNTPQHPVPLRHAVAALVTQLLVVAVIGAALIAFAGGSIGPGRLATTGANGLNVAMRLILLTGVGAAMYIIARLEITRSWVRRSYSAVRTKLSA